MLDAGMHYAYADTPLGQLHYAECGQGEPLVLLHQTPRSLDEFREVQPLLADGRRVIAMDMYGFGMSAKPPDGPQRIEQYAAGVIALADALGLTRFAVLGHHTGMYVASEVAASAPDRISAAIFSAGGFADEAFRAERRRRATAADQAHAVDVAALSADGDHLRELWAKRRPDYPGGRPDLLNRFIRDALAPGVDPAEGHRAVARYVMEARVALVTAPLLVLAGTEDPAAYPHLAGVASAYPAAASIKVVEIEGGHIPLMEDKMVEVVAVVNQFLTSLGL